MQKYLPMQILSRFEYTVTPTEIPIIITKMETKMPTMAPPLLAEAENKD